METIIQDEFVSISAEIVCAVAAFVIVSVAAGGGIGGGGAMVPLFTVVGGLHTSRSIPLSKVAQNNQSLLFKATIFGSAIASLVVLSQRRHPGADRPLIDYRTAFVFVPTQLLGTMIGVICNRVWPRWLVTVCLVLFLGWITWKTYKKAFSLRFSSSLMSQGRDISVEEAKQSEPSPRLNSIEMAQRGSNDAHHDGDHDHGALLDGKTPSTPLPLSHLDLAAKRTAFIEDERTAPKLQMLGLVGLLLGVTAVAIARGGESGKSPIGVQCGSSTYWLLFALPFPLYIALALVATTLAKRRHDSKKVAGFPFVVSPSQSAQGLTLCRKETSHGRGRRVISFP